MRLGWGSYLVLAWRREVDGWLALAAIALDAGSRVDDAPIGRFEVGRPRDVADQLERLTAFASGRRLVILDVLSLRAELAAAGWTASLRDPARDAADLGVFVHLVHPEWDDPTFAALCRRLDIAIEEGTVESEAAAAARLLVVAQRDLATEPRDAVERLRESLIDLDRREVDLIAPATETPHHPASPSTTRGAAELAAGGESHSGRRGSSRPISALRDPRNTDEPVPVASAEIDAIFAESGPLARCIEGYRVREPQVTLARSVAAAITGGRTLLAEAGTGTGKSLGYLMPLVLHAIRSRRVTLVSTHTKSLQAQLLEKDLPIVGDALGVDVPVVMVKGRRDYLCRQRLKVRAAVAAADGDPDLRLAALFFERLSIRTRDGDLERLSPWILRRHAAVRAMREDLRCEHGASGSGCSFGEDCFYPALVRRASTAALLVANHALALRWPRSLPQPEVAVFDEAHALIDVATDAFSTQLDLPRLRGVLSRAIGRGAGFSLTRLMLRVERRAGHLPDRLRDAIEDGVDGISRLIDRLDDLALQIDELFAARRERVRRGRSGEILELDAELRVLDPCPSFERVAQRCLRATNRLAGALSRCRLELTQVDEDSEPHRELAVELGGLVATLDRSAEAIDAVMKGGDDRICWLESSPTRRGRSFALIAAPLTVGASFAERVLHPLRAAVLTSATLRSHGGFGLLERELGLTCVEERRRAPSIALGSPFDYGRALRFFVPLGGPDALAGDPRLAALAAARVILSAAERLRGRVLGLFNARDRLAHADRMLRAPLQRRGVILLTAGRDGTAAQVLARFREERHAVLLGSRALFEGIDVAAGGLRCAVLDRIPFDPPDDPVHRARAAQLEREGRSGFFDYSLPRAILRLRQGAGRLIRAERDEGAVVIVDPRVATRRDYGAVIRDALPAECTIGPEATVMAALWDRLQGGGVETQTTPEEALAILTDLDEELGSRPAGRREFGD